MRCVASKVCGRKRDKKKGDTAEPAARVESNSENSPTDNVSKNIQELLSQRRQVPKVDGSQDVSTYSIRNTAHVVKCRERQSETDLLDVSKKTSKVYVQDVSRFRFKESIPHRVCVVKHDPLAVAF